MIFKFKELLWRIQHNLDDAYDISDLRSIYYLGLGFESFLQWYVGIIGGAGFLLLAFGSPWGFVLTATTEPLWFLSTAKKRQWGMFFLTALYTVSCGIGIYRGFIKLP